MQELRCHCQQLGGWQRKTLASVRPDASFSLFEGVDGVYLNYSAVPEPTSLVLVLLSGIPLLRRKRA